jgi:hypothetical protein
VAGLIAALVVVILCLLGIVIFILKRHRRARRSYRHIDTFSTLNAPAIADIEEDTFCHPLPIYTAPEGYRGETDQSDTEFNVYSQHMRKNRSGVLSPGLHRGVVIHSRGLEGVGDRPPRDDGDSEPQLGEDKLYPEITSTILFDVTRPPHFRSRLSSIFNIKPRFFNVSQSISTLAVRSIATTCLWRPITIPIAWYK